MSRPYSKQVEIIWCGNRFPVLLFRFKYHLKFVSKRYILSSYQEHFFHVFLNAKQSKIKNNGKVY